MQLNEQEIEKLKLFTLEKLAPVSKVAINLKDPASFLDLCSTKTDHEEFEKMVLNFNKDRAELLRSMRDLRSVTCFPNHPDTEQSKHLNQILGSKKTTEELKSLANEVRNISSDELEGMKEKIAKIISKKTSNIASDASSQQVKQGEKGLFNLN